MIGRKVLARTIINPNDATASAIRICEAVRKLDLRGEVSRLTVVSLTLKPPPHIIPQVHVFAQLQDYVGKSRVITT